MEATGTATPIRNVSDTALWVAVYRAMESERTDALFHDPYARRLAGERGPAIVNAMPQGKAMAWAMIVRTAVMDELILQCVREGAASVLNLAAGLDTRAYRLDLPSSLRWYHVDFPPMVDYVRDHLADEQPRCVLEYVSADLREPAQRDAVFQEAAAHGPVLVITEGLLVYLPPENVAELAVALRNVATAKWWISDLGTPLLLKRLSKTWLGRLRDGNAPFLFAPADAAAFFNPLGWRETVFRSSWTESLRLNRHIRFANFWNLLMKFSPRAEREASLRMSGISLMQPISDVNNAYV
jgi:methyltransferase (TIGR00027 family)